VPARSGSKGIPGKNLIQLDGQTLVNRAIDQCVRARLVDHVAVSSDEEAILEAAPETVTKIHRPKELARDDSPIDETFQHAISFLRDIGREPEVLIWLQPNVPIRKEGIVDEVVEKLRATQDATAVVTCKILDSRTRWAKVLSNDGWLSPLIEEFTDFRRQDLSSTFLIDGSVIAFKVQNLSMIDGPHIHSYLGERIIPIAQEQAIYSLELDEPSDLLQLYQFLNQPIQHPSNEVLEEFFWP